MCGAILQSHLISTKMVAWATGKEHQVSEIIKVALPDRITGDALAAFQSALMMMDDYRQDLVNAEDWESLCYGLTNLIEFKQNLAALVDSIQNDIYQLMPGKKTLVEGLGTFEKRRSNSKKWESERLLNDIVSHHLNNGTGEITPGTIFGLVEDLKKAMPITPSLGWRTNALKEMNIEIDDYCQITWGRPTISVTK
jgi:uncharacterized phage infection (PIP) family protein YhgE